MERNKVLIPRFMADYIKETKEAGCDLNLVFAWNDNEPMPKAVQRWLFSNDSQEEDDRRFLIAVSAWVNGYEIEEDKYYWALSLENCIQPVFLLDDPQTSEKNYFADTVEDMKDAAYITESEALNILVEDFHMFRKLEANEVE
ncbi:DUF1642 domain-containing protein [Vagococcus elongatus]|uniref:DUF1642 domain-containing protein n=1 Tax=Vagococcus elongatus TaxID=180344 RepID=A0A430AW07_9ENTE|nr:DUF1642 domain-containing protein [Vagococcus elongatus]RSU12235.1 hypothetical protein CBF29_06455 [Vagococcus elongatus]